MSGIREDRMLSGRRRSNAVTLAVVLTIGLFPLMFVGEQVRAFAAGHKALSTEETSLRKTPSPDGEWQFVVSGDSRNCGDVVMPAIAAQSAHYKPSFYWHLGDLRAIYKIDEDMAAAATRTGETLSCEVYHRRAWSDFIENQIAPFGDTPFFVGIGNHEVIPPKTEEKFTTQFADWLLTPVLQDQRRRDGEQGTLQPRAYYHWVQGGVDFIYLDNASDTFSEQQLKWFDRVLAGDAADEGVRSIVVGMHEALPDSIARNHSMCDNPQEPDGCTSGRHVYEALLDFQNKKPVYVLASHSHYYMEGIFDNLPPQRRLPGWIIGTAGAVRYALPKAPPPNAKTDVYGFLLATVDREGRIKFEFQQVHKSDVPASVQRRYPSSLIRWCFAHNSANLDPAAPDTTARCTPPLPAASR